jgi:chemotaxis protein MotA
MVVAFVAVFSGILMLGGNMGDFLDPASAMLVIVPTIAALFVTFPPAMMAKIPKHMGIVMRDSHRAENYIDRITDIAKKARREGLLSLENEQMDSPIAHYALRMIIDGVQEQEAREWLEDTLDSTKKRHEEVIEIYERGASYAPAFGMCATVIALINMLMGLDFSDAAGVNSLGMNMSAALITTFYGCLVANVFFLPVAARLKLLNKREIFCNTLICNGLLAVQRGSSANLIEDYMREQVNRSAHNDLKVSGEIKKNE